MAAVTSDPGPSIRLSQPAGRWVLLATVLGSSMAMLDATVVNVALPTIGRHLGASLGGLQWTVTAYTLTLAGLILLGGALGDRLGRRRVFITGVAWFALASALCAVAPSFWLLLGGRILQGLGNGGLMTLAQALVGEHVPPRQRGSYQGYLSANIVAGSTIASRLSLIDGVQRLGLWVAESDANFIWVRLPDADAFLLERCRPVYETLPGWRKDVCGARRLADLPAAARRYVDRLAELLGLPVTIISVGPDRTQTIFTKG